MSEPALRLVTDQGEAVEPADVSDLRRELEAARKLASERYALLATQNEALAELRRNASYKEAGRVKTAVKGALATDIRDVLLYHGARFMGPEAKVIPDSRGWQFVEALLTAQDATTGKPAFTVDLLCESVDGAWLDDWYRQQPHRRYATSVFGSFMTNGKGQRYEAADPDKVQRNIDRLHESNGRTALSVRNVDQRRRDEFLIYLAEDCSCGHLRVEHLDATGGCGHFDGGLCGCEKFLGIGERIARWREAQK